MVNLSDLIKIMGKHRAFTVPICGTGKALELGAWCLMSETFLYLSGVIHLVGRCLIGEALQYLCAQLMILATCFLFLIIV